jgi:hypothetical protein
MKFNVKVCLVFFSAYGAEKRKQISWFAVFSAEKMTTFQLNNILYDLYNKSASYKHSFDVNFFNFQQKTFSAKFQRFSVISAI